MKGGLPGHSEASDHFFKIDENQGQTEITAHEKPSLALR